MKTVLVTLAVAVLAAMVGALLFVNSGIYDVSAVQSHGGLTAWLTHTTMEASVQRRADKVAVPDLNGESLLRAGVNDFDAMCVGCHGAPGQEPGPVGQGLNPPAPDLAQSAVEMSPAELFWVTKNGIRMTGMPAWSATHSDQDLWPVVALMKALPDMDAAGYTDLKARAEGLGHHGGGESQQGHRHDSESGAGGHDHESEGESEGADAVNGESTNKADHDHSTHEH